jgi:hypothetical protein
MHSISTKEIKMCSIASGSKSFIKSAEKRISKCLRCEHEFTSPKDLYKHLWNNKTDCNKESEISIENAKKYANPPDYYKCQFCKEIIVDKIERENHELKCDKKDIIDTLEINNINPLISYLFIVDDSNKVISNIDKETGYINGTLMCKSVNKELNKFMKLGSSIELINEFKKYNISHQTNNNDEVMAPANLQQPIFEKPSLLNLNVNHTYFHEQLAIPLAMWCSPKYVLRISKFLIDFKNGLVKTEDSIKTKQDIQDIIEEKIKLSSCTNYINKYDPQVYFITFDFNFKELDAIYFNTKEKFNKSNGVIVKYGNQKKNSTRQSTHKTTYDNYKLLDTIKCYDHDNLEKYIEEIIENKRIKIIKPGKLFGEEYIYFENKEEYVDLINQVQVKAEELNKKSMDDLYGCNTELEIKKEETKQKELYLEEEKERTKQEKEKTRQLELQVELKRLESKKEPFVIIQENYDKKLLTREEPPKIENTDHAIKIEKDVSTPQTTKYDVKTYKKKEFIYHGVHKAKYGKYEACICKNKKYFYLGAYVDPKVAAYAYNCKALELHGKDYNKFNNIEPPKNLVWNSEINKLTNI